MVKHTQKPSSSKPRPDFPLFPHATGRWCKKVRGKFEYFGKVEGDPKGAAALDRWLDWKDDLLAGRRPKEKTPGLTVGDLCNRVLNLKRREVTDNELSLRTFKTWYSVCQAVVKQFGENRLVESVGPDDFEKLLTRSISGRAASSRSVLINFTRGLFNFAFNEDQRFIPAPVLFGRAFRPPELTRRENRSPSEIRLFTVEQLRQILDFTKRPMRAMILLGINCGFGNNDCATLTFDDIDLETGWHNYRRPKTKQPRRCPLWPETVEAIEHSLKIRPKPRKAEDKKLVFLTRFGYPYIRLSAESAKLMAEDKPGNLTWEDTVSTNMWAILHRLEMKRNGLSFYTLRHTFETIGGAAKDQIAVDYIMGHKTPGMGTNYRHAIDDDRLLAVTNHVHDWLFGEIETK